MAWQFESKCGELIYGDRNQESDGLWGGNKVDEKGHKRIILGGRNALTPDWGVHSIGMGM